MNIRNTLLPIKSYHLGMGVLFSAAIIIAGCSGSNPLSSKKDPFAGVGSPIWDSSKGPMPKGGGRRHIGKSYQVAGIWFHPKHQPNYNKVGVASWYGPKFNRRMTSNGEWFDMEQLTAAHTTMELPSYAKVTNLSNGREVIVRVNDRGPFVNDRIIDLSRRAADVIGSRRQGKAKVRVQYLGRAPLKDPDYSHLAAMNQELERNTPTGQLLANANLRNGRYGEAEEQGGSSFNTASAGATGPYYIQVASFADPGNAERTKRNLSDISGIRIQPASGSYGTLYRVQVGPIDSEQQALSALETVRSRGHYDALMRSYSR